METTSTEEKKQQFRENRCKNFSVVDDIKRRIVPLATGKICFENGTVSEFIMELVK